MELTVVHVALMVVGVGVVGGVVDVEAAVGAEVVAVVVAVEDAGVVEDR